MSTRHITVDIHPRNLRSFGALDAALDKLRKEAIDAAADVTRPVRLVLSFSISEGRVA
jgi:hypothetical protein